MDFLRQLAEYVKYCSGIGTVQRADLTSLNGFGRTGICPLTACDVFRGLTPVHRASLMLTVWR